MHSSFVWHMIKQSESLSTRYGTTYGRDSPGWPGSIADDFLYRLVAPSPNVATQPEALGCSLTGSVKKWCVLILKPTHYGLQMLLVMEKITRSVLRGSWRWKMDYCTTRSKCKAWVINGLNFRRQELNHFHNQLYSLHDCSPPWKYKNKLLMIKDLCIYVINYYVTHSLKIVLCSLHVQNN